MTMTTIDVRTIPAITHREAGGLSEEEYGRFADLLETVSPSQWSSPTDCADWTVRDLAGHMVGAMRSASSLRESLRQQREIQRRAKAVRGSAVDQMTALQIELTSGLTEAELVAECRKLVLPAAKGRRRTPAPARRFVSIPVEMGSISERWNLGYLVDIVLTRDTWMHRIDLSRAIDGEFRADAAHDGRIVEEVVAEWARRHGQPFTLALAGVAGGVFAQGAGGPSIQLDAVEFCRALSGRAIGEGLLTTEVPF